MRIELTFTFFSLTKSIWICWLIYLQTFHALLPPSNVGYKLLWKLVTVRPIWLWAIVLRSILSNVEQRVGFPHAKPKRKNGHFRALLLTPDFLLDTHDVNFFSQKCPSSQDGTTPNLFTFILSGIYFPKHIQKLISGCVKWLFVKFCTSGV